MNRRVVSRILLIILCIGLSVAYITTGDTGTGTSGLTSPKTAFSVSDTVSTTSLSAYTMMRPTIDQIKEWNALYISEKAAPTAPVVAVSQTQGEASMSLLEYLPYTPSERDQDMCGNCWVWASTGAVEIAHAVQNNVYDRLSVQYVNSRYNNGGKSPFSPANFACNGGTASQFASFYNLAGRYGGNRIAIPWTNVNAAFMDGNASGQTQVNGDAINTTPHYAIKSIASTRIPTTGVSQEQAIANIKSLIDDGQAVYLGYYLPDQDSVNAFTTFWATSDQDTSYFDIDQYAGEEYTSSGAGHAVLVTGYTDDGTVGYWQCLNSWGAPSNRPDGTFYIDMYMDYDAQYVLGSETIQVTTWQNVAVTFTGAEPTPTPNGTISLSPDFSVSPSSGYPPLTVHFSDQSTGSPTSWSWNFGDDGGSRLRSPNHTYAIPGTYTVSLTIGKGDQTAVTETTDAVTVKIPYVKVSAFPSSDGGFYPIPTDPDGDGRFEDINGNGWLEFTDPLVLLKDMEFAMKKEPVLQFDFDASGFIGYDDIVTLQKMV